MCIRHAGISMGVRGPLGLRMSLAIAWVLFAGVFALGLPFVVDRAPPGPDIRPVTFLYLGDALLTSLVLRPDHFEGRSGGRGEPIISRSPTPVGPQTDAVRTWSPLSTAWAVGLVVVNGVRSYRIELDAASAAGRIQGLHVRGRPRPRQAGSRPGGVRAGPAQAGRRMAAVRGGAADRAPHLQGHAAVPCQAGHGVVSRQGLLPAPSRRRRHCS